MKLIKYIVLILMVLPLSLGAQKISSFETQDYTEIKIYDDWADSPFNLSQLTGNIAVIPNNVMGHADSTANILSMQRSRFGSHLFGAEVVLKEPFELTPTAKYIHVLINKPVTGRAMLLGLGKRTDRPGQSDRVVQFYSTSITALDVNEWTDAVFQIKGNGGIMIYSLVVVPDAESTHNQTADYMAYIDEIEINDSPVSRSRTGDYLVNFENNLALTRTDRHLDAVRFTGNQGGKLTVPVPSTAPNYIYKNMTDSVGLAVPGEVITPTIGYTGNWMHGYVYLDYQNDGKLDYGLNANGTPALNSDVVSYSYYNSKNSLGNTPSSQNPGVNPPAFTIPANTVPGIYRLRYKVDWDNIDPGGNINSNNHIQANGGGIVDVLINIHKTTSHVKITTRNGAVLHPDNSVFEESDLPFGQPIEILLQPEAGFKQNGVVVKHGYLDKEEFVHGNRQWRVDTIPASRFVNDKFTIPATMVNGDLEIIAEFAELTSLKNLKADGLEITTSKRTLNMNVKDKTLIYVFNANGACVFTGKVEGKQKLSLNPGVYLVNNKKVVVP